MPSPNIVEAYGNTDSVETSVVVVGFEENKAAWMKGRADSNTEGWSDWSPIGTSADHADNAQFANLEGCSFKLGNIDSLAASE